jgi:hypothetical protein
MSNYVGTSEYIDGSGFTCDVCGTRYGDDASGELSNKSDGKRLICMTCSLRWQGCNYEHSRLILVCTKCGWVNPDAPAVG